MRKYSENFIMLDVKELTALCKLYGFKQNKLSMINYINESTDNVEISLKAIPAELEQMLKEATETIAAPDRTVKMHCSIEDENITRLDFAWKKDNFHRTAVLAQKGEYKNLTISGAEEYAAMASKVLALESSPEVVECNKKLSSLALITILAMADYYRHCKLLSMLNHKPIVKSFSLRDIIERIEDSSNEDFRWALLFMEKVLPFNFSKSIEEGVIEETLEELVKEGFINKDTSNYEETGLNFYLLADLGEVLVNDIFHDISKVAMTIGGTGTNNGPAYETIYFIRSAKRLWMFNLYGKEGIIASVGSFGAAEVLNKIFMEADSFISEKEVMEQTINKDSVCGNCGIKLKPNAKFCYGCGEKVDAQQEVKGKFCANCGIQLKPNSKFCAGCGTPVKN